MKQQPTRLYSDRDLVRLLIPMIVEQALFVTVGMADSLMVAGLGEAAVSAVSLVDTINVLLVGLLSALATGGAVVTGQFMGARQPEQAQRSAEQLLTFVTAIGLAIMALTLGFRDFLVNRVFGDIEPDVASQAMVYFNITQLSLPFVALYCGGVSLFRIMGNSRVAMIISLLVNLVNVVGNAILIFGFKMGVAGAAIPTLVARIVGAGLVLWLLRDPTLEVHLPRRFRLFWDRRMVRQIVGFGVPNGVEHSMFQLGKILLMGVIAAFGTASIAANAIGNTMMSFQNLPGSAAGTAMLTIVSQCVGQRDFDSAHFYTRRLLLFSLTANLVINLVILPLLPLVLSVYNVSQEAKEIARWLVLSYAIGCVLVWTPSFTMPCSLRAAGDTKYVMVMSTVSMWVFRLVLGIILGKYLGYGVKGVWIAMYIDWTARAVFFYVRYKSGKWRSKAIT